MAFSGPSLHPDRFDEMRSRGTSPSSSADVQGGGGWEFAGGWATPKAAVNPPPTRPLVITPNRSSGGSSGGGGGVTKDDKKTAKNLNSVFSFNARTAKDQWGSAKAGFDQSDKQNRAEAKKQKGQASATSASDRFAQMKRLQSSAAGMKNSAGNALQGSQALNLSGMIRERNNMDTGESVGTLRENFNTINNALNETLNKNSVARNEAARAAEISLRNLESEHAAQLSNIHPSLYKKPGKGKTDHGSKGYGKKRQTAPKLAASQGYFLTAPQSSSQPADQSSSSSYFDRLMNGGY